MNAGIILFVVFKLLFFCCLGDGEVYPLPSNISIMLEKSLSMKIERFIKMGLSAVSN